METVDLQYLTENVEKKESKPHVVYLGSSGEDLYREHLESDITAAIDGLGITAVWYDAFSDGRVFAARYAVVTIPTILFFRRGQLEVQMGGFVPPHVLREVAEKASRSTVQEMIERLREEQDET